jgi:large subunit ribosomal protein L23
MKQVLKRPVLSEKSMALSEKGHYVFEVMPGANKIEIRRAVEERYNVGVKDVRTINMKSKRKFQMTRQGYITGRTAQRKKAIVTLREGYSIDVVGDLGTGEE